MTRGWDRCTFAPRALLLVVAALALPSLARAQSSDTAPPAAAATPADAAPVPPKFDGADNAWVLTSSTLVLMMTAPALALFYCGLVRKKNVLSVMMQCLFLMCAMTVLWALYGYSLVFGGDGPYLGDARYCFLRGAEPVWTSQGAELPLYPGLSIPILSHMLFQGMFFIITPALMCGAFAERMKFSALVLFMVLWNTLIYCPLAHWVWGGGFLTYGSPHAAGFAAGGAIDFAGGTVIHVSSGVSALVCALFLGKRLGYGSEPMPPHNMTYTAIGAAWLWFGWFGFNAGSALSAGRLASIAFTATHLAAGAGGLAWVGLEWRFRGKPSVLGVCSGLVAGLACVTQAAGYVTPMSGLVIGAIGGSVCYMACTLLKARFGYDDSLDVFGVHGVAGTLGAVLTGVFATRATGAYPDGQLLGLLEGGTLLQGQLRALLVAWGLAAVGGYALLKIVDVVIGVRVPRVAEVEGLDLSQHEEEGYILV